MNTLENIEQTIIRYLEGETSPDESLALEAWVTASDENRKNYLRLKNIWEVAGGEHLLARISPEKALAKVLKEISPKLGFWAITSRVAAVLMLPLMFISFWIGKSLEKNESDETVSYVEVHSALGTRSSLKLPDGSKVWLNSASRIEYPSVFNSQRRTVKLDGQAFFEVESDKLRPFVVQTKTISVVATGTEFDVKCFKGDTKTNVTLKTGKVSVVDSTGKKAIARLLPNQKVDIDNNTGSFELSNHQNIYKFIAWKDGKMIFRNEPLGDVIKEISRYYDVDIDIRDEEVKRYPYRATFNTESLDEILKLLKLSSPINYVEVDRKALGDSTFTKRKIIITKK